MSVDPSLPPFVRQMLEQGAVLEPIRLDRSGRWWHRGNPIENRKIAALFDRSVGRTAGGTWILSVGRFTYPVEVVDTPYFVRGVSQIGDSFVLLLSDTREVAYEVGRLQADEHGLVYHLSDGFRARFSRAVYIDFAERWITESGDAYEVAVPGYSTELLQFPSEVRDSER